MMGLLRFLFGKRPKVYDPFFGEMDVIVTKNSIQSLSGERIFAATKAPVSFIIDAGMGGISDAHRNFYEQVEKRFTEIVLTIIPIIENEFRNWKEDFSIINFTEEFELYHINLPYSLQSPVAWEMIFKSDHDLNHDFSVTMCDFEAKEILIDG